MDSLFLPMQSPVKDFMEQFQKSYESALFTSQNSIIVQAVEHLQQASGKRIRPMMVALMAQLCGCKPNAKSMESAIVLELLHTASLIHDDVVDHATIRRDQSTLNALFSNHIAVLVGDYLVAKALTRAVDGLDSTAVRLLGNVAATLAEGELTQIDLVEQKHSSEEQYMQVIEKKTATLFSSAAFMGAYSVQAPAKQQERCLRIGHLLGLAFQIRDDVLDLLGEETGKSRGKDLKEGKLTLPLIYALKQVTDQKQAEIMSLVELADQDDSVEKIVAFTKEYGGIAYAQKKIEQLSGEAIDLIELFPPSQTQESLKKLAHFIGNRTY